MPLNPNTMAIYPTVKSDQGERGFFACKGRVRVWDGQTLLAETTGAFTTAMPESNGDILIPERDTRMDQLRPLEAPGTFARPGGAATPLAWRATAIPAGHGPFLSFDPDRLKIEMEDAWPGPSGVVTVNHFPRWGDLADLMRSIDVAPAGPDRYQAPAYPDIRRNVVEGHHQLSQAIVAASKAVPEQHVVSAHMIFSKPAVWDKPLDFAVARQRVGRSMSTLGVQSEQDGKMCASALLLMDHGAAHTIQAQIEMPKLPGPEASEPFDFGVTGREIRVVGGAYTNDPDRIGPPEIHAWVRHRDAPKDRGLRQALIARFTGNTTIAASMLPHPGVGQAQAHVSLSTGNLVVTVSFHDDADPSQWLLYSNPSIFAGHGLVQGEGHVFAQDGRLVASYSVMAMVRAFTPRAKATGLDVTRIM